MKVSNVAQMRKLDHEAINAYGFMEELLMENAGIAAFSMISQTHSIADSTFAVICGTGNNGGDGLVVARKLISMDGRVLVAIVGDAMRFRDSARLNYDIMNKIANHVYAITRTDQVQDLINQSDCIIDALLGTGLDRDVDGIYAEIIDLINQSGKSVISLDIPSGINGNTGAVMGRAVKATHTISFGLPKIGNILYPGFQHCGKLYVSHISFPPALYESHDIRVSINTPPPLAAREPDSHKGDYGKMVCIAGSAQYLGAPYFSAMSYLRAGGGLSYLATPDCIATHIGTRGSELIILPQRSNPSGSIAYENKDRLLDIAKKASITIIGPGLSLTEETQRMARELIARIESPLLIDGDAITAISDDLDLIRRRKSPTIITPHPGEMARLCGTSIEHIREAKVDILRKTCIDLNSIITLKGAHTLIGFPNGDIVINLSGNAGMATAGSGDVLTGTIAAMTNSGYGLAEASKLGVFIHGFAGDLAVDAMGGDGTIASDIMNHLPEAIKLYRINHDALIQTYYHKLTLI